jgi:hypothetical protein
VLNVHVLCILVIWLSVILAKCSIVVELFEATVRRAPSMLVGQIGLSRTWCI